MEPTNHLDVLVVGAGLSGIDAGYHLQTQCPRLSYAILEAREAIGGTWNLFRYPGIRSDSDMFTLGYPFRPWNGGKAIADGASICRYIEDTAREFGIDQKIRFGHRVERASWSSETGLWTLEARRKDSGEVVRLTSRYLLMCSGYYDYAAGFLPDFPNMDRFKGRLIHPQKWPEDLDVRGKRVIVIGSGATAVTLVPALATDAASVIMLQRSPSYVASLPNREALLPWLAWLPGDLALRVIRWKNVLFSLALYKYCRHFPERARRFLIGSVRQQLGPDFDVATHFTPSYDPWDQRLCLAPDADFFRAIREGRASVVTDHIESFTESGLRLKSGAELAADIIVTATGLRVQMLGGAQLQVDGRRVALNEATTYKGAMFSDVPNFAVALGYTNASWTLKTDLVCEWFCRVLGHMERRGYRVCCPRLPEGGIEHEPLVDLSSGYVQRAIADLPRQGARVPWRIHQNYLLDLLNFRYGPLEDGVLQFSGDAADARAASPAARGPGALEPAPPASGAPPRASSAEQPPLNATPIIGS